MIKRDWQALRENWSWLRALLWLYVIIYPLLLSASPWYVNIIWSVFLAWFLFTAWGDGYRAGEHEKTMECLDKHHQNFFPQHVQDFHAPHFDDFNNVQDFMTALEEELKEEEPEDLPLHLQDGNTND